MKVFDIAQKIDISAVRTHNGISDIEEVVGYAKRYSFINVHVLPNWVKILADMIRDVPNVYVGSPVGFPSGAHCTQVKLLEAQQLIEDGVQEMDIVMNVGRFKSGQYDYVLDELKKIIALTEGKEIKTKVLIELNCLTDEELPKACEIVIASGADFLKTGTGWVRGDANIARIRTIKKLVGDKVEIKAAGGIRTRKEFDELYDIGVTRFGINTHSAIEILKTFE
jgi:deoxyribose-phosphate aldolase